MENWRKFLNEEEKRPIHIFFDMDGVLVDFAGKVAEAINKNLMLHSYQIKFMINDRKYTYTALLPDYFKKLLKTKRLRFPNS